MGKRGCGWGQKVGPAWGSDLLHKPKDLRVPLKGTGSGGTASTGQGVRKAEFPVPATVGSWTTHLPAPGLSFLNCAKLLSLGTTSCPISSSSRECRLTH